MAKSTERHARENRAKIARSLNVSAETVRRVGIVQRTFSDGETLMESGAVKVNKLYKLAKGDNRVGLHVLIDPDLRAKIKQYADENNMTVNDLLTGILTKIFW